MKIVGYSDRLSVEPGQSIDFMISCQPQSYQASVVRLYHGDTNPHGPGYRADSVPSAVDGTYNGVEQLLRPGSYGRADFSGIDRIGDFTVSAWIRPTTPDKEDQTVLAATADDGTGFELGLRAGVPTLTLATADGTAVIEGGRPVESDNWYFLAATYDAASRHAAIMLDPLNTTAGELADQMSGPTDVTDQNRGLAPASVTIAARLEAGDDRPTGLYNGKIDSPRIFDRALSADELAHARQQYEAAPPSDGLLAAWDFSKDISSTTITDVSRHGRHGRVIQRPTRAVTGPNWDGSESSWRHAPNQYGAIHFHDDDLDDAGWDRSVQWTVPADTASGIYALRLETDGGEDEIPFVVRPPRGQASARALFIVPTFSYLAYGNEHMLTGTSLDGMSGGTHEGGSTAVRSYPATPEDRYIVENRLHSLYDRHSDGSGVCYSSWKRPVVNMRPRYVEPPLDEGNGAPHQFNADLHLVDWLYELGYPVDVVTDDDLYREGWGLLDQYKVVLTGTHHEYWSAGMLDALYTYLNSGGRLMYLSGNGFYWVTELDPENGHTVEIRRRPPSTRAWETEPGEGNLSFTGELGGLWRYRNRTPQRMVGIGFSAQGLAPGRPYTRCPDSFDPEVSWVFDGIDEDEPIGDHPCLVSRYGAAGFEVDRVDYSLGTPHRTKILATATGFSDAYQHCSEEVMMSDSAQGGTVEERVRADMVLLEYPHGGGVFAPGSIAWCGCLSYDNYKNAVSRITQNVLDRFLA